MPRKQFQMTEQQYAELQAKYNDACANTGATQMLIDMAWDELGSVMGFDGATARCMLGDPRTFTAIVIAKD